MGGAASALQRRHGRRCRRVDRSPGVNLPRRILTRCRVVHARCGRSRCDLAPRDRRPHAVATISSADRDRGRHADGRGKGTSAIDRKRPQFASHGGRRPQLKPRVRDTPKSREGLIRLAVTRRRWAYDPPCRSWARRMNSSMSTGFPCPASNESRPFLSSARSAFSLDTWSSSCCPIFS